MRNKIEYEWCYETLEDGDIVDNDYADKLKDFSEDRKTDTLALVRTEGNEIDGVTDRLWAYVKDGELPEFFSDATDTPISIRVPLKYIIELSRFLNKKG